MPHVLLIKEKSNYRFEYMMLDRLQQDCDYYLNFGNKDAKHSLWAKDEQLQIEYMYKLYDLLPEKPKWITREQIDEYAVKMGVK